MSGSSSVKPLRVSVWWQAEMMVRHAWLVLCASNMVDPRRAPHPWREVGGTSDSVRIEVSSHHVGSLLMLCRIALASAQASGEVREAKSIASLVGKVSARYPGVEPMPIDAWKAVYRVHPLPPLDQVSMTEIGWQEVHDVWMHVR